MGVDAKAIRMFMWKILRFSMINSYKFIRKYPVVWGVSLSVFFLYNFFPSVFYFLLYSSPIIAYAAVFIRKHLKSKHFKIEDSLKERKTGSGLSLSVHSGSVSANNRNGVSYLRPQRSVRRNARRKVEEVRNDWDSQASEDEKDKVVLTTLYNELLGRRTPKFEESAKESTILGEEETSFEHRGESSLSNLENQTNLISKPPSSRDMGGETKMESLGEEDDEEETQEDRNKAVQWTEGDQKNLMNLGISEIERNKRLESLIARRRSRKLFPLAAEKRLMDMEIPLICVGRNMGFDDQNNYDFDGLQMPGSAPSVLLPSRNPFDLPYDPQEEKPNLMGDSFHQEFGVANQRYMLFCRHESFCRTLFPSEYVQDAKLESFSNTERKAIDGPGFSVFRRQLDKRDDGHLIEQQQIISEEVDSNVINLETPMESCHSNKEEVIGSHHDVDSSSGKRTEVQIETDLIRNDDSDSNASFSPRENEKGFRTLNQAQASETSYQTNGEHQLALGDHVRNSLIGLVPRSNGSSSLASERQRYMEHFGYITGKGHMVTHSMDSDLQVEVSDIGSPPTTVDGNDSSDDEKLSHIYESDVGNEMGFSIEDTELKLKDENELIASEKHSDTITSSEPPVQEVQQGLDNTRSSWSKVSENIEGQSHFMDMDGNSQAVGESKELRPSNSSNAISPEESTAQHEKPSDEIKLSYDFDEPKSEPQAEKNHGEPPEQEIKDEKNQNHEEPTRGNTLNPVEDGHNEEVVSDVNQRNFDEPASPTQQAGQSIEHVSLSPSTSLSPRSVLLDKLPLDQSIEHVSPYSLNFEDWEHIDAPHNDSENTEKDDSLDDQPPFGDANPDALQTHLVENFPKESPGPSEKPTEDTGTVVKEASDKELPQELKNANSDTTRTVEKKEMATVDSPGKSFEDARMASGTNDLVVVEKINKDYPEPPENSEGISHFLIRQEHAWKESNPMEDSASKFVENETDVVSSKEVTNYVSSDIGEFMKPIEHENVIDSSKQFGTKSIRDVQEESKTVEERGSIINSSIEEVKTDQTETPAADTEGKECNPIYSFPQSTLSNVKESESYETTDKESEDHHRQEPEPAAEPPKPASEINAAADSDFRKENPFKQESQAGSSNAEGENDTPKHS